MKIKFLNSISKQLQEIAYHEKMNSTPIDYVELSIDEYVQLLEEVGPLGSILIKDAFTKDINYNGLKLKVLR
jgi:hypothetical protein